MKKMINRSHIEGLLYESSLEIKQSGPTSKNPGANYIRGTISVQIANDNIVGVEAMEMEFDKNGKKNTRYDVLANIMSAATVLLNGEDAAVKLKIDSALDVNDWYNKTGELISVLRNSGGFVHIVKDVNPSATFEVDMLITSTNDEMKKDEAGEYVPSGNLVVNGYIFNFRNTIMPVKLLVESANGIEYFRNLDANTFTKVWGKMESQTVTNTKVEESAFGDNKVIEYTNTRKKFCITGANPQGYEFGEDTVLTVKEVQDAIAARNIALETEKTRAASSNSAFTNTSNVAVKASTGTGGAAASAAKTYTF